MTGGQLGHGVKPLKAPDGSPHDLGLYMIAIDPGRSAVFGDRLAGLQSLVSEDPDTRMPGQGRVLFDVIEMPDTLWETCRKLAGA